MNNKYLNKALIYSWFRGGMGAFILAIVMWGFLSYNIVVDLISRVKDNYQYSYNNNFITLAIYNYIFVALIFIGIYYIGQGFNRRSKNLFLYNGPYTKKQIKLNMLFCMLMSLVIFTIIYAYMFIVNYFAYKNFIDMSYGYFISMGVEIVKFVLFGIVGILLLFIIDLLFNNTYAALISIIAIFPLTFMYISDRLGTILSYTPCLNKNMSISDYLYEKDLIGAGNGIIEFNYVNQISKSNLFLSIGVVLIFIIILFTIYSIFEKRSVLNYSSKIFAGSKSRNFMYGVISICGAAIIRSIFIDRYISDMRYSLADKGVLYGTNLIKVLSIDLGSIIIISVILFIIISKSFKKLSL